MSRKMTMWGWCLVVGMGMVTSAAAQPTDSYEYNSEFIWGLNKNTSGGLIGGFIFKKAKRLSARTFETYGLEIMNVKHPQEARRSSQIGNFFIYGKSNYLYTFRLQYGRDFVLFTKGPQQGAEIKAVFAAGPSIGLLTPYYIERAVDNSAFITVSEAYDPRNPFHEYQYILGPGNLFQGLGNAELRAGLNFKAALNFELGVSKSSVSGFEIGFLGDGYLGEVELMPAAENSRFFPTIFLSVFYGSRK